MEQALVRQPLITNELNTNGLNVCYDPIYQYTTSSMLADHE